MPCGMCKCACPRVCVSRHAPVCLTSLNLPPPLHKASKHLCPVFAIPTLQEGTWILFDAGSDVHFRRMRLAAKALGRLHSTRGMVEAGGAARPSADEVRVRQILIGQKSCRASTAAAQTVEWMTPEVRQELQAAIQGDATLNDAQRSHLMASITRTITLIEVSG